MNRNEKATWLELSALLIEAGDLDMEATRAALLDVVGKTATVRRRPEIAHKRRARSRSR